MQPPERAQLARLIGDLPDGATVLEFGSGHSSFFILHRLTPHSTLHSVEHSTLWATQVLLNCGTDPRFTLHLVPLDVISDGHPQEERVVDGSDDYFNPPVDWSNVRLVLVDGIMRAETLRRIRPRLVPPVIVLLHDYIGREDWYADGIKDYWLGPVTFTLQALTI